MPTLKTVFDTCKPRSEILSGVLKEQEFAASLTKVLRGTADVVYQDPAIFFANTYPTSGLKTLLTETLGRLTGKQPTNSPIIRLETSFGGGKTHSLIGLYHVCCTPTLGAALEPFVDAGLVPSKPITRIAGIVGPDLETAEGLDHGDCRTYTLWGEIAYQLGGKKGYEAVRKSDEARTAPGTGVWEAVIGDEPCLVMLDEIAYYLRVARGTVFQVGGTSLAEQTVAGLMSLLKFAAEHSRTVVVLTLADSGDAFGRESDELREELKEAQSLAARQEHIITPAADDEISAIVLKALATTVRSKPTDVVDLWRCLEVGLAAELEPEDFDFDDGQAAIAILRRLFQEPDGTGMSALVEEQRLSASASTRRFTRIRALLDRVTGNT